MSIKFSKHYLPVGRVIDFYESCWPKWMEDRPDWFDEDFRKQVPREFLVKVEKKLWFREDGSGESDANAGGGTSSKGGGGGEMERKGVAVTPL
jgi:hypothetical protein